MQYGSGIIILVNLFILNGFGVRFVLQRDFGGEQRLEANGGLEKNALVGPRGAGRGCSCRIYILKKI